MNGTSSNVSLLSGINAVAVNNSITDPFKGQFATLLSGGSTAQNTTAESLVKSTAFTVSAVFSLALPAENRNSYGIQLSDKSGAIGNDENVRLSVQRTTGGSEIVSLNEINGVIGSNNTLQSFVLNGSGADQQIDLQLSYDPANQNNVSASFTLLKAGGVVDSTTTFTATGRIFDTQNFTQAQYFAQAPAASDSVLQGSYGTFDITQAGSLTYTLANGQPNVQALMQGQSVTDTATVQASDNSGNTTTTTDSVTISGASPHISVNISGSGAPVAASFSQFLGFGDSNTDSGYFFNTPISNNSGKETQYQASVTAGGGIPTSLGGVMNSTLLAQDYGLSASPYNPISGNSGSALGTNYAASGATVTGSLKGSLAPSITSQITTYLNSVGGHANADALYLISGGGNDAKIAEGLPGQQGKQFMVDEANALANALIQLHADGANYIIIDDNTGRSTLGAIFNTVLDSDLGDAEVPFINSDVKSLIGSIEANPAAYGILNIDKGTVGTSTNPYNEWAGGADVNPDYTRFAKGWALYATQLVTANAGNTYLWADNEHLSAIGQQIEANYDQNLVQTSTPVVSETLTANPNLVNGSGSDFSYQWQSQAAGANAWNDIAGQQSSTYEVQQVDVGDHLRVEVSFIDSITGQMATAFSAPTLDVRCYCPGTLIRTPDGEKAVETLKCGELVLTTEGCSKPVRWLGRQTVSTRFADPLRVLPIRIKAGALGDHVPSRDFLLSPDHAILINDVLIQAGALVNNTSIIRETNVPQTFTYYHVELDDHSLILAENTPAETFIDNVDRLGFDNWLEHEALYPEGKPIVEMPYPRAKAHRQVPRAIREQLAERSVALYGAASAAA